MKLLSKNKKLYKLISVMACSVLLAVIAMLAILYQQALNNYKEQLHVSVNVRTELIETISQLNFDNNEQNHANDTLEKTLGQVVDVHKHFNPVKNTREFLLIEFKDNNYIPILHSQKNKVNVLDKYSLDNTNISLPTWLTIENINLKSSSSEWVEQGALIVYVHFNIGKRNFFAIEKISMSEIKKPFIKVLIFSLLIIFFAILIGNNLISKQIAPIIDDLNQQVAFTKIVFDTAIVPIITTDTQYKITALNKATSSLFLCSEDELIGQPLSQLFDMPINSSDRYYKGYKKGGEEMLLEINDGASHTLEDTIHVYTVNDVTLIKSSEEQLCFAMAQNAAVIDTVPDAIFILDNNGNIITANPAAEKIFGYYLGELEALHISELIAGIGAVITPQKNTVYEALHKEENLFT